MTEDTETQLIDAIRTIARVEEEMLHSHAEIGRILQESSKLLGDYIDRLNAEASALMAEVEEERKVS